MLKQLTILATIFSTVANAEEIEGFAERPATDAEISYCDNNRDLSGQVLFLGPGDNAQAPLDVLMCHSSTVWQMDCDFAKALKSIFDFSLGHPELGGVAQNGSENLNSARYQCDGLFLS